MPHDLTLYITKKGMDTIQNRIHHLMNTERPEVIKAVAIAREFGDLSENAEYKAAREHQRAIDHELDYLRRRSAHLINCHVILCVSGRFAIPGIQILVKSFGSMSWEWTR
jgi:hypothetical protein